MASGPISHPAVCHTKRLFGTQMKISVLRTHNRTNPDSPVSYLNNTVKIIGTVSRATVGKPQRHGMERMWAFPGEKYCLELNCKNGFNIACACCVWGQAIFRVSIINAETDEPARHIHAHGTLQTRAARSTRDCWHFSFCFCWWG